MSGMEHFSVNNWLVVAKKAVKNGVPKVVEGLATASLVIRHKGSQIGTIYRIIVLRKSSNRSIAMSKPADLLETSKSSNVEVFDKPIRSNIRSSKRVNFKSSAVLVKDVRSKSSNLRAERLTSKDIQERLGSKVYARSKR